VVVLEVLDVYLHMALVEEEAVPMAVAVQVLFLNLSLMVAVVVVVQSVSYGLATHADFLVPA
jgi:hypothetical protein